MNFRDHSTPFFLKNRGSIFRLKHRSSIFWKLAMTRGCSNHFLQVFFSTPLQNAWSAPAATSRDKFRIIVQVWTYGNQKTLFIIAARYTNILVCYHNRLLCETPPVLLSGTENISSTIYPLLVVVRKIRSCTYGMMSFCFVGELNRQILSSTPEDKHFYEFMTPFLERQWYEDAMKSYYQRDRITTNRWRNTISERF